MGVHQNEKNHLPDPCCGAGAGPGGLCGCNTAGVIEKEKEQRTLLFFCAAGKFRFVVPTNN